MHADEYIDHQAFRQPHLDLRATTTILDIHIVLIAFDSIDCDWDGNFSFGEVALAFVVLLLQEPQSLYAAFAIYRLLQKSRKWPLLLAKLMLYVGCLGTA